MSIQPWNWKNLYIVMMQECQVQHLYKLHMAMKASTNEHVSVMSHILFHNGIFQLIALV